MEKKIRSANSLDHFSPGEWEKTKIYPIILAAGQGKRMCSSLPKVLHKIAGFSLISYSLHNIAGLGNLLIGGSVIVSKELDEHKDFSKIMVDYAHLPLRKVYQGQRLGTGDAVAKGLYNVELDDDIVVLVLYGDVPLLELEDIRIILTKVADGAHLVGTAFFAADPKGYGRIISQDQLLLSVVEEAECDDMQRKINLCNGGILACRYGLMREFIRSIQFKNENENKKEIYLTDIFTYAAKLGLAPTYVEISEKRITGINNMQQLATAENYLQQKLRAKMMGMGVCFTSPETVTLSADTIIGSGTTIGANVSIGPGVVIGEYCEILPNSVINGSVIASGSKVGPFAFLREGTVVGKCVRIGSFVETKNAKIGDGAKAPHLSYLGDVTIGSSTNIGAGTIICNYDGFKKYYTSIGKSAFIGANSSIISPRNIGDRAKIGAGSVIVCDVPNDTLAVARSRQVNKVMEVLQHKEENVALNIQGEEQGICIDIESDSKKIPSPDAHNSCGADINIAPNNQKTTSAKQIAAETEKINKKNTAISCLFSQSLHISNHNHRNILSNFIKKEKLISFYKMRSNCNTILVIDLDANNSPLTYQEEIKLKKQDLTKSYLEKEKFSLCKNDVALLCDYDNGIGCDQIMLVSNISERGAVLSIYNNDGSESSAFGNGMGCLGLWASLYCEMIEDNLSYFSMIPSVNSREKIEHRLKKIDFNNFLSPNQVDIYSFKWLLKNRTISTFLIRETVHLESMKGISGNVIIEMGQFYFREVSIELPFRAKSTSHIRIDSDHLVIIIDDESKCDMLLAKSLAGGNILFPDGVNVSFVVINEGDKSIAIKTWDKEKKREAASCASASAACHIAVFKSGLLREEQVVVNNIGGSLISILHDNKAFIFCSANLIYCGQKIL